MIEINNTTKNRIDRKLIIKTVEKFLKLKNKKKREVSIAFIGDASMRKLNKVYRKKDKPTDILVFSESAAARTGSLGEIIIDYAQIKRQAKKYGNSAKEELLFILVHGLLHLIGMEDDSEKGREKMEKAGKEFIKKHLNF